jgi:hypothetical protein
LTPFAFAFILHLLAALPSAAHYACSLKEIIVFLDWCWTSWRTNYLHQFHVDIESPLCIRSIGGMSPSHIVSLAGCNKDGVCWIIRLNREDGTASKGSMLCSLKEKIIILAGCCTSCKTKIDCLRQFHVAPLEIVASLFHIWQCRAMGSNKGQSLVRQNLEWQYGTHLQQQRPMSGCTLSILKPSNGSYHSGHHVAYSFVVYVLV